MPIWITTYIETGEIVIHPDLAVAVGYHYLYASFSTIIPDNAFYGLNGIATSNDAYMLKNLLISFGYIDSEGYLTRDYNPDLILGFYIF